MAVAITAFAELARFDGMIFKAFNNDHLPPHIHVDVNGMTCRISVPDGSAIEARKKGDVAPSSLVKKMQSWFRTKVPGSGREVGDIVYDQWLRARNHQPVGHVPTPDEIKVLLRSEKRKKNKTKDKTSSNSGNFYAISSVKVLPNDLLEVDFSNGETRVVDMRAMLGQYDDYDPLEHFAQATTDGYGVSWPVTYPDVTTNTMDLEGQDVWGAGVLVQTSATVKSGM